MFKKFERAVLLGIQNRSKRKIILIGTFIAFILSIMMIPTGLVLVKMLPEKDSNTFNIYVKLPAGSSIHETQKVTTCVYDVAKQNKYVQNMELFLGSGSPLDFAGLIKGSQFKNSENVAEMVLNLTNKHDRDVPSFAIVHNMRPLVKKSCEDLIKGSKISFVQPPSGPPVLDAIVAEIYANNAHGIRELSSQVEGIFKHTKGLVDVDTMEQKIYTQYDVKVDENRASLAGVSVKQINNILYLAFKGKTVAVKNSKYYNYQIPIFLSLSDKTKQFQNTSLQAIYSKLSSLKLMNSKGMMVPLIELVKIYPIKSDPMILNKDLTQMTNVMASTDMVSQVYPLMSARDQILKKLSKEYKITKTGLFDLQLVNKNSGDIYKLKWGGEMKVTLQTFEQLGAAFIAALVLIFLLMVVYYKSYVLSSIILLGSFLSIIGVILGHFIMNLFTTETFFLTATSLIGFIALIGISSRNSLLLIDFTKSLMKDKGMQKAEAIAFATATRAKPIFLTATAIILASTLLASDPVFGGLGVALIFGTVAAVVASLIVVPILLYMSNLNKHFNFHTKKAVSVEDPL
jgi:multidrug efflux pump subunit AcrB